VSWGWRAKKLEEAAHRIVTGKKSGLDDLKSDLESLGVLPEKIKSLLDGEKQKDFELWPQNQIIIKAFNAVCSQWNIGFDGALIGLNYAGVEAGLRLSGIKLTPYEFWLLQYLEVQVKIIANRKNNGQ